MGNKKKVKPSLKNPALSKLLADAKGSEIRITGEKNEPEKIGDKKDDKKEETVIVIPEKKKKEIFKTGKKIKGIAFATFFAKNEKFNDSKEVTTLLFDVNRDRLKQICQTEDAKIVHLLNNIVDNWLKVYEKEAKKSIEKRYEQLW